MSEDLLRKFLDDIENEDGLMKKVKRKRTKSEIQREKVKEILAAASKGQVELPPEERFIVEEWRKPMTLELSDKLAKQGFSLVEQVRAARPTDLMKRNLKYMQYMDKKRKLDAEKAKKVVMEHLRKKESKDLVRKERDKITCLREPKKEKRKDVSVFDDADFAVIGKRKNLKSNTEKDDSLFDDGDLTITGKKKKTTKSRREKNDSIFDDADFAVVGKKKKQVKSSTEYL